MGPAKSCRVDMVVHLRESDEGMKGLWILRATLNHVRYLLVSTPNAGLNRGVR